MKIVLMSLIYITFIKMATRVLAENTQPDSLFGKVHQAADLVQKAHGIYKAGQWLNTVARPAIMSGLRAAAIL